MYHKILTKPKKWTEKSLALATKEELIADLLLRKSQFLNRKSSIFPWDIYAKKQEIHWIEVINNELKQRNQWIAED